MNEQNENNPKKEINVEKALEETFPKLISRIEEHGGDYLSYIKQYNRHRLEISLTNEQTGNEDWGSNIKVFYNEDNAYSHFAFIDEMLDLLLEEENRDWGTILANEALVERILNFVRKKVSPPKKKEEIRNFKEIIDEMKNNEKKGS